MSVPDARKASPPALKHGAYSAMTLLPGEDAFLRLHGDLIAELEPHGSLEEDALATIARLMWRKQNVATYRVARQARERVAAIRLEMIPGPRPPYEMFSLCSDVQDAEVVRSANRAASERAAKELGQAYQLTELGDVATPDYLLGELSIHDKLDSMIDRCLKRLLFLRGLKSLSPSNASPSPKRLKGG